MLSLQKWFGAFIILIAMYLTAFMANPPTPETLNPSTAL